MTSSSSRLLWFRDFDSVDIKLNITTAGEWGEKQLLQKKSITAKYTLLLEHKISGTSLYGDLKIEILAVVSLSLRGSSPCCLVPCFSCHSNDSVAGATQPLPALLDELLCVIQAELELWKEPGANYIMQLCCCDIIIFSYNLIYCSFKHYSFPLCTTKIIATAVLWFFSAIFCRH